MKISTWYNCYDETLKAFITPESFAHPAKMAKRLTERIIEHGEEEGYWRPGDVLIDPFGGIGTTGLIGAYRGYRVVSLELEPRFVGMQQDNIKKNAGKLARLGKPLPVVVQGDARFLTRYLSEAIGSIFSPPYADQAIEKSSTSIDYTRQYETYRAQGGGASFEAFVITQQKHSEGYGSAEGQIGALKGGDFDQVVGAISSPPYSVEALGHAGGEGPRTTNAAHSKPDTPNSQEYGVSEGQIGALREGKFDQVVGAVTSPPYEGTELDYGDRPNRAAKVKDNPNFVGRTHWLNNDKTATHYGDTEGQISAESGETYWQAMRQVYGELYKVIRPGGVAAIVVKNFVRNKQIVPLCDMTATLLEAIGFEIVERTHAMLVKETHAGIDMFSGEAVTKKVERKSFFRRLAESKGSPAIDYEEVLWAQKPGGAAEPGQAESIEIGGGITSPPYVSGGHHPDQTGSWGGEAQSVDRDLAGYGAEAGQIGKLHEGDFEQTMKGVKK